MRPTPGGPRPRLGGPLPAHLAPAVLAGLLLFVPGLGNHDLWAPDEPRYAQVAREMLQGGDWLLPHVNGRIYTDKPPAWFWAAALLSLPAGDVTAFTARLVSALAATLLLVLVVVAGGEMVGRRAALAGAAVLATSYGFFTLARSAHLDLLLTLVVSGSLFAAWRLFTGRGGMGARLALWSALAVAVLVKGPVGFILPLLVVILDRLWAGEPRDLGRLGAGWGLPLALAPSLAWLAAVGAWRPGYDPWAVLDRHVLGRFHEGLHHARPAWYHLVNFFVEMAPWSFLVPGAILAAWRFRSRPAQVPEREDEAAAGAAPGWPPRRFLLGWMAATLGLLSLSSEKRGLYILPLLPAAALLVGGLWDGLLHAGRGAAPDGRSMGEAGEGPAPPLGWVAAGLLPPVTLLLAFGALPWLLARRPPAVLTPAHLTSVRLLAVAGAAGGAALLVAWLRRQWPAALGLLAGGTALLMLLFVHIVEPAADSLKSARFLAQRLATIVRPGDRVGMLHWRAAYLYYSGIRMDELNSPDEAAAWLAAPGRKVLLLDAAQQEMLSPLLARARVVAADRVGHRQMRIVVLGDGQGAAVHGGGLGGNRGALPPGPAPATATPGRRRAPPSPPPAGA